MAILETKNLTYTYGVGTPFEKTAVENVNLSVEKGAFVGVIGHTGSGKSTLIQMLNGLIRPTSGQVLLNGEDVSGQIRTEKVGNMASAISVYPEVRAQLLKLQRDLAASQNVIMDGRDIGTCILPDADAKIFLTADASVRAMRRYKELSEKGAACNLREIEQDIIERDNRDKNRETAPLKAAKDAVLLDTSDMAVEQVVQAIIDVAVSHGLEEER